jgi:ATP-binding cassette subfamily B protein
MKINLFELQLEQRDCGVACLLNLIRYYGGNSTVDELRRLSGTSVTGTTLLGLKQAAEKIGFDAEGCEADIPALLEHGQPVV